MKSDRRGRGKSFTKSHLMLDLIADLENVGNSEVEEEGEVYDELEENKEEKDELQEDYSQIKSTEVCIISKLYNKSLTNDLCRCQKITNYPRTAPQRTFTNWWTLCSFPPGDPFPCLHDIDTLTHPVLRPDINDFKNFENKHISGYKLAFFLAQPHYLSFTIAFIIVFIATLLQLY